jgi:hypothetical protein
MSALTTVKNPDMVLPWPSLYPWPVDFPLGPLTKFYVDPVPPPKSLLLPLSATSDRNEKLT